MNWTKNQSKVIEARNCNLLVSAAAGSGKTAVLVERIIQMISDDKNPINIDELLVVTFTKAAAAQMRDKIAIAIEKKLMEDPSNKHLLQQVNLIQKANIMTIDSFCYQVVKEHFHIIGIDPCIRIGEKGEVELLKEEVLETVMEEFYENNKDFVAFSDAFSDDKNDEKIEKYITEIYKISSSYPRPNEWIRLAKDSLNITSEKDFMNLDYVKNYIKELKQQVEELKSEMSQYLKMTLDIDGPKHLEKIIRSDLALVDDVISARTYSQLHDLSHYSFQRIVGKTECNEEIEAYIRKKREEYKKFFKENFYNFALSMEEMLEQFAEQKNRLIAFLECSDVFRTRFLEKKIEKNLLEFSDVEHFALQILCKDYDENGILIPSEIGIELSEQFHEILIDEYQDSNYLQEDILLAVSRVYKQEHNIFMVGDVKQSIYSFRMARPDLFMRKYDIYGTDEGAEQRKILLKNNFRSRANILESINYIFYQIMNRDMGGIHYTEDEALVPGAKFPDILDDSVEFIIGESSNFKFLDEGINAKKDHTSKEIAIKEQNLDENLEDIGKYELEATMVANRILKLFGKDGSPVFQVMGENEELRDIEYKDIVLLMRSPSKHQQIFSEVLASYGIPMKIQNNVGYLNSIEVSMIISLLRVVDNPYNDIECVATLRSYFGGFSQEELSIIGFIKNRLFEKYKYMYQLIEALAVLKDANPKLEIDVEDLKKLIKNELDPYKETITKMIDQSNEYIKLIRKLQEMKSYMSMEQLLTYIYYELGYYYYILVMPNGEQRRKNLQLLCLEAKKYEETSFHSIFDFLRFIDRILKKAIPLGSDDSGECNENMVQMMSIHKSKGLEFPIVFLVGMGKKFNKEDRIPPLIIHADYYLGAEYRNVEERYGNNTFSRSAISSLMHAHSISEELRLLYVALTRAKEKLIMTGVTSDLPKLVEKYSMIANHPEQKLPYTVLSSFENYLEMVVAACIRNKDFHDAMHGVRTRFDKKGETLISADYDVKFYLTTPNIRMNVSVYDFETLSVNHIKTKVKSTINREEILAKWMDAPSVMMEKIEENQAWKYKNQGLTKQKSKISVTEVQRIYEQKVKQDSIMIQPFEQEGINDVKLPYFIEKDRKMSAAKKGTWMHKLMELLDFKEIDTKEDVEKQFLHIWQEGWLPMETKSFIDVEKVWKFFESSLGKRMIKAAKENHLYKEKQFIVGVSAHKLQSVENEEKDDLVLVQGIIDAYFKEGDSIVIVDYKTDFIKEGQDSVLLQRYETQLRYYKDTLEKLVQLPVKETYLYSFGLNREMRYDF